MLNSGPRVVLSKAPIQSFSEARINTGMLDVFKHGKMQGGWSCFDKVPHANVLATPLNNKRNMSLSNKKKGMAESFC